MAAGGRLQRGAPFLCPICLDVFRQPVTTPCGHNYCRACIAACWDSSVPAQCPVCEKSFGTRPQLQVNVAFREMLEHFSVLGTGGAEAPVKPGEVPCDICVGPKLKARKTCLPCLASYCERHLEPHLRVAGLKKHQLTEPVSDLEDRVCKEHGKMLELFCQPDQLCICFMCLKDGHVAHEAVPLRRAHAEKTAELLNAVSRVKMTEEAKSDTVREVRDSIQRSQMESDADISSVDTFFSVLGDALSCRKAELISVIRDKREAAVTEAERFVAPLERELAESRRRRSTMEQLLRASDHLRLLQEWPSLQWPERTEEIFSPVVHPLSDKSPHTYAGIVKQAVDRMEKALNNEMELLFHEVRLSDRGEAPKRDDADEHPIFDGFIRDMSKPEDRLLMIQRCHAVDVRMDWNTVAPGLVVSEDGKQLGFLGDGLLYCAGFTYDHTIPPLVFATEGYSSGKFYYEVQVGGADCFCLGVSRLDVSNGGHWVLASDMSSSGFYSVFDESLSKNLFLTQKPEKIGVFVDYDNGEVSFYDVGARALIYSFTGCHFTGASALRSPLHSAVGGGVNRPQKLYPTFATFGESSCELVVTPVDP